MRYAMLCCLLLLALPTLAQETTAERVEAAMQADIRTEAEKKRDANRKPVETLQFLGIEPDMKLLELIPGGGWYTKLLAPLMRDEGSLHVSIGTSGVDENLLDKPGFEHVKVLDFGGEVKATDQRGVYEIDDVAFAEDDFDAVLTFRNMHNFTEKTRKDLNAAVYDALKPGGIYGVVDHTRRHMQPDNHENRRRLDPVLVVKEVTDAGFDFVDYSDLHYRPDDELRYEVGRKTVTGNTDRFTFLFRKPETE